MAPEMFVKAICATIRTGLLMTNILEEVLFEDSGLPIISERKR